VVNNGKLKSNETETWFRHLITPSNQEINLAYSTAPGPAHDKQQEQQ